MKKTEFIKAIATQTGFTQKDIKTVIDAAQDITFKAMAAQDEVKVFDGVTLVGVHKDATTARNPIDGSSVAIPEKVVPKAKFGAVAKRIVNGEE